MKRALRNPGASESDRKKPNDKGAILTVKPIWCLQSCLKNCQKATKSLFSVNVSLGMENASNCGVSAEGL